MVVLFDLRSGCGLTQCWNRRPVCGSEQFVRFGSCRGEGDVAVAAESAFSRGGDASFGRKDELVSRPGCFSVEFFSDVLEWRSFVCDLLRRFDPRKQSLEDRPFGGLIPGEVVADVDDPLVDGVNYVGTRYVYFGGDVVGFEIGFRQSV